MKHLLSLEARVWSASILNAVAVGAQLWTLVVTKNPAGLSLIMLGIFLYMQVTYAQLGLRTKQRAMFWGMATSAVFTSAIIVLALLFR
ncbi:MAG: hypothetical protein A2844_01225 [Candidatus Ryanbacteria bacterium RIFCSPHIGHO2_01_FULL_48_80]|nr:MAG: hypothetical protein A2844_01225 [Candidatus Ryanbacteria bacterium RIFCSPHIGHO2_01_FULL_48_80]